MWSIEPMPDRGPFVGYRTVTVDKRDNSTDPTKRSVAKIVTAPTETGRHWASFLCGLPAAGMTAVKPLWPRLSRRRSSHIRSCGLQDQRELDVA